MKSSSAVRANVKQLLVIYEADLQVIEEADAANDINREVLRLGEIHNGVPLHIANGQCDFVAVSDERTGSGADALPDAGFQIKAQDNRISGLKDTELASRIDFGSNRNRN